MNAGTPDGESPSWEQVEHYLSAHQSVVFALSRDSRREVTYQADGPTQSIELIVELHRGEKCPPSPSEAVDVMEVSFRRYRAARVRNNVPELTADFHELITTLAARILRYGYTLAEALGETIRSWHRLIDAHRLQESGRLGLHGELLVLAEAADTFGWRTAVASWVGPQGEVHDFSFPDFDVEVKTTSSERRRHRVNGLGQLTPKPDRTLWCASVQAVRGGDAGRSLRQSVDHCLFQARTESVLVEAALVDTLRHVGLTEFDDAARDERWLLRSTPILFESSSVPRLDSTAILPEYADRVSAVAYDIDLTGLAPPTDGPFAFQRNEFP